MKKRQISLRYVGIILSVGGLVMGTNAAAQTDPDIDDLFDMDLEELTVSVASKRDEKVFDAPSVISVVTREEIFHYGARNLLDILNRVPSLQFTNANLFRNNAVSVRGQSVQHYSNRILFLINGRPFRDSNSGGFNVPLFMNFPIDSISHLEIIRGPGSVLYGTNAFSSVINIITREGPEEGRAYASATYGSYDYRSAEAGVSKGGEDWNILLSGKAFDQEGWEGNFTSEFNTPGSYRQDDTGYGVLGTARYKGFSINSFFSKVDQKGISLTFPANQYDLKRIFIDAGYVQEISGSWEVALNVTFNRFDFVPQYAKDVITELTVSGEIFQGLNLIFGGSYEDQDGVTAGFDADYDRQTYSAYFQMDYKARDWLKLVVGGQYNAPSDTQNDFSPRVALVANFDGNWGTKLMYGEAFRTAYAVETFINIPGIIVGDPAIRPEKIATTEVQFFYHSQRFEGALTFYHSKVTDIIVRIPALSGGSTYSNEGKVIFKGIEFEGKASLGGGWSLQGSALLQENKDDQGEKDTSFSPNITIKAGVSYSSDRGYSIGIFEGFYGTPTPISQVNPAVNEVNPAASSYHLLTANMNFDLNKLLDLNDKIPLMLSVYGDNLFNEDIYYPEYNRKNINSFPSYAGRTVYATLKVRF